MDDDDQRKIIEYSARLSSTVAPNAMKLSGKTVHFIGWGPYSVEDIEALLPSDTLVVSGEHVTRPDYVVLGTDEFDEHQILSAVEARHDSTSFLPQDGFLDLILFGYDWWAEYIQLLDDSKDWHPGMRHLHSLQSFRWPGTEAPESTGFQESGREFKSETDLHKLGYKLTNMTPAKRWQVLTTVAIPRLGLKEVAGTIASHIRNRKRQVGGAEKYAKAIRAWEYDLQRLKTTYYKGTRANFHWPSTGI